MQLLFMYIEKYLALKTVGLNLGGSPFIFDYSPKEGTLEIGQNHLFINDFFKLSKSVKGPEINISAIIGKNGAGKTSLLKFMKENLCWGAGGIKEKGVFVFRLSESGAAGKTTEAQYLIYHHDDLKVSIIGDPDFSQMVSIEVYSEKISKLQAGTVTVYDELEEAKHASFIFYSNIIDRQKEDQLGNLHNISTNYLLNYDKLSINDVDNKYVVTKPEVVNESIGSILLTNSQVDSVSAFKSNELKRQIQFLSSKDASIMPFRMDLTISMSMDRTQEIITLDYLKKNETIATSLKFVIEAIDKVLQSFDKRLSTVGTAEEKVKINFYRALFMAVINNFARFNLYPLNTSILESLLHLEPKQFLIDLLLYVKDQIRERTDFTNKALIPFMEEFEHLLGGQKIFMDGEYKTVFIDLKSENDRIRFYRFIDFAVKASPYNSFLFFDWVGAPSSGEESMLSFYSRFYWLKAEDITSKLKNRIIILIDEGELYLHPLWQKQYIKLLIDYFSKLFASAKSIQVILTSHSPFVVSDLPKSNITFLDKDHKLNKVFVSELETHKHTFAANIHSLLTESFFMEDGLVGDFANEKINQVITLLTETSAKTIEQNKDYIEKLISIIGEPVIKAKLLSLLEDVLKTNLINLKEEMEELKERISKLEKRK